MRMEGRLLPFNFEDSDGFPLYQTYLENFYHRHKNPADVSITDAAFKCLKENNLRLSWLPFKAIVIPSDALLSNDIFDCMLQLVQNGGESQAPFVIDAAALLRLKGCKVPYSQYTLSQGIRRWAFKVAMFQGKWSPDIAAVLLGIIKEAELILEYMRCGNLDAVDTSNKIRSGLTGEFEKNRLEKKRDDMGKQPKEQKTNGGLDFLSLLEKGYLTRKSIIATDMC